MEPSVPGGTTIRPGRGRAPAGRCGYCPGPGSRYPDPLLPRPGRQSPHHPDLRQYLRHRPARLGRSRQRLLTPPTGRVAVAPRPVSPDHRETLFLTRAAPGRPASHRSSCPARSPGATGNTVGARRSSDRWAGPGDAFPGVSQQWDPSNTAVPRTHIVGADDGA